MKKIGFVCAAFAACSAVAGTEFKNVEPSLQKALGSHGLKSAQMHDGALRVLMDKTEVTELVYATFVYHDICAHQWRQPQQFAQWGLTRVEVMNTNATQGFAFDARGTVCADMGHLGKNFRSFIQQRTTACAAQACAAK